MWERFNLMLDATHGVTPDEVCARLCDEGAQEQDNL